MVKRIAQGLRSVDVPSALALTYTAAMLMVLDQVFLPTRLQARMEGLPPGSRRPVGLEAGVTWAVACMVGYSLVPMLIVVLLHRRSPAAVGWRLGGVLRHLWVYVLLYLAMLPAILLVSERPAFIRTYPFVRGAADDLRTLLWWETAYVLQFFALESFFRGYLLFTLERRFGWNAVFVMTVPYCLIHVHKPLPEALGAIGAGLVLGFLALRFRSWLGGALLHAMVAVTMDLLAVNRLDGL